MKKMSRALIIGSALRATMMDDYRAVGAKVMWWLRIDGRTEV